ncbi:hypothetical protein [Paenarthrobacter nitroguajacolicus]|uniref:hypothetical protein n=1 Tax=Paenarthrobacter nitroguajacolicus TaxID=211146 RepID=UPI0028613A6C|nr:hypothetical protein [Paenarthrobacter nitroguajacolicus]MDR6637093.1 hypothetical protein [Paenarthrobacter nitroguajacolicus]
MKPHPRSRAFANFYELVVACHGFERRCPVGTLARKRSEGPCVYARCLKLLDQDGQRI